MESSQLTATSYIPMQIVPTRISALLSEQEIYMNKPKMQRSSESWPRRKRQYFIESLLRGIPVGSMILHHDAEQRAGKLWIADGLQRLTAITDFAQGCFKTGRLRPGSPSFGAFEPNKRIDQLSSMALNQFKGYALPLYIIETADPDVIKFIFLSLQESVQLTLAEKLYAKGVDSDSMLAIEQIQEHPFFSMYSGDDQHQETFMMAQFPIILELFGGFANLSGERLHNLNSNMYADRIDNVLLESIEEKMLLAQHLFSGVRISSKNEIIFMYQCVNFLNFAGFDLDNSQEGALTEWYKTVVPSIAVRGETKAFSSLLSQIHKNSKQQQFWQTHCMDFAALPGLRSTLASIENMERLGMWLHYRHFCPQCGEQVGDINHIAYHKFLPTDGACLTESTIKFLSTPERVEAR